MTKSNIKFYCCRKACSKQYWQQTGSMSTNVTSCNDSCFEPLCSRDKQQF